MRNPFPGEGGIQQDRVLVGDYRVVHAIDQKNGRAVVGNMHLQGQGIPHPFAAHPAVAQDSAPRALVYIGRLHGDNRVNGRYKGRTKVGSAFDAGQL